MEGRLRYEGPVMLFPCFFLRCCCCCCALLCCHGSCVFALSAVLRRSGDRGEGLSPTAVCGHGVEPLWNQPVLPVSHAPFLKKGLNYFIAFFTNLFCSKHTALQYPSMFKSYWILMKVDGTQHYYICSEASCDFTH